MASRHEVRNKLQGETLGRKGLMKKHDHIQPMRLLPDLQVVKIGGHGTIDFGREVLMPLRVCGNRRRSPGSAHSRCGY